MSWPTGPPRMPPPGWYADPEQEYTWRWFDGLQWTALRAPMPRPRSADPQSFSAWFDRSIACVKLVVRRFGLVLVGVWLTFALAMTWLSVSLFESDRGRELRRLFDVESTFGSTDSTELTTDGERAWELLGEIFVAALPWLVVLGLAAIVAWCWSTAAIALVAQKRDRDPSETTVEPRGSVARAALARAPMVFLAGVALSLIFVAAVAAAAAPVALVAVAGGDGAAIILTTMFSLLLASAAGLWLWGRLSLTMVIAAVGGNGLGIRRSWELTHGRFWYVLGRVLIAGLIAGTASGAANSLINLGVFLGFAVFVAILLFTQAIGSVAAQIISICALVVTVGQADAASAGIGSSGQADPA